MMILQESPSDEEVVSPYGYKDLRCWRAVSDAISAISGGPF